MMEKPYQDVEIIHIWFTPSAPSVGQKQHDLCSEGILMSLRMAAMKLQRPFYPKTQQKSRTGSMYPLALLTTLDPYTAHGFTAQVPTLTHMSSLVLVDSTFTLYFCFSIFLFHEFIVFQHIYISLFECL